MAVDAVVILQTTLPMTLAFQMLKVFSLHVPQNAECTLPLGTAPVRACRLTTHANVRH